MRKYCFVRDVKLEYKNLKEKIKELNKKEAKFYGNMFAKMTKVSKYQFIMNHFFNQCLHVCGFMFFVKSYFVLCLQIPEPQTAA